MKASQPVKNRARRLLRLCFVDGALDEMRARYVTQRVLQSKRRGYVSLLKHFQYFLKLHYAQHTAEVESAVSLAPDLQSRVKTELVTRYGSGLTTVFALDPSLIGGMRIRVGSDVYDGSIRFRLATMGKNL